MADSVQEGLSGTQEKPITIEALQKAIEEALRKAFPKTTVCGYDKLTEKKGVGRKKFTLPALVLSLASFEQDQPTGTEQLAIGLRWELRVVCSSRGSKGEIEVRELASLVAAFVHDNRFGMKVKGAQFIAANPDEFSPAIAGHVPWLVEFEQSACLGVSCFDDDFTTPEEVYVSISPEIGLKHKDKYYLVTEEVVNELPTS